MFQSSLDEAGTATSPVSQACFNSTLRSGFARHILLSHPVMVLFLMASLFSACESGLVRQVHYFEKVGDTASARQHLEAELLRRPDNAEARYLYGKVLFAESDFVEGRKAFDQVEMQTARYSESIQFMLESGYREHLQAGIDALDANNGEGAVQHFEFASQIRPEYNPGHRLLGYARTQIGQLNEAALAYQQAVMVEPTDFESWHNLADIAFVNQDYETARTYAEKALDIEPQNPSALRRLAHAHMNLQENAEAKLVFEQLLTQKTGTEDLRDYAYFLFNTGNFEASLPHLETLVAVPEPSLDLLKTLSETYAGLQLFKKVIGVNEQILSRLPEDRGAIGNMIAAHERLGQFEQAQQWQAKLSKLGGEM